MIIGIRQKTLVGENGKVEIPTSDIPSGTLVDVIVLVEPSEQDTTDYLLSNEANRNHLLQALQDLNKPSSYTYINLADL